MKPIRQISIVTTLTLALMAGSAMTESAAGRDGWGGGSRDDECAYRVQKWESDWRRAMQREGQGSWNERTARSELDRARADCCRSGRWSWCDENRRVIPESRYVNPNDPDRIYLDRNPDGSYRGGNDWSNGLGGSHSGDGDRGGRHGGSDGGHEDSSGWGDDPGTGHHGSDKGHNNSGGWQNDQDSGGGGSDTGRHHRDRGRNDRDNGRDDQGGWW
jgi:hypothetical protein